MLVDPQSNLDVLDTVPYSLAVLDADGVILSTNRMWRDISVRYGADPARCGVGANYCEICEGAVGEGAADGRAVSEAIRRVTSGEAEHLSLAYQCVVPEIGPRWFEVRLHSLSTEAPRQVVVVHHDITEQRLAKMKAEERRRLLASMVQGIGDFGIFVLDSGGHIGSWNSGAEALTGYRRDEALRMTFADFYCQEERAAGVPESHLAASVEQPFRTEGWRVRKDGSKAFLFCSIHPLRDLRSELLGYALILGDVTALRHAEAALGRAVSELQQRNRDLEQFVYTVSHDLKTPLVTISGFSAHAREDLVKGRSDRLPGFVDRINAAAARMSATIDDLLRLSRIGGASGTPKLICVPVAAGQILSEMQPLITERNATVMVDSAIPDLYADPTCFREVVENLICNALKYGCPEPGMQVHISGRLGQESPTPLVHLLVRDHGPGVPEDSRQRVFGLFQRLSSRSVGTGVGLAIVKRIAEMHGGSAWIEEPPAGERGVVFAVSFPASAPASPTTPLMFVGDTIVHSPAAPHEHGAPR